MESSSRAPRKLWIFTMESQVSEVDYFAHPQLAPPFGEPVRFISFPRGF